MKDIVEAFFRSRNIINHQLASFNDFLPTHDNPKSRMQRIIDSIRIGEVDNERGLIRLDVDKFDEESIDVKLGRITVGNPIVKEANGATHEHTPLEARLRDLTYSAPISLEFTIIEEMPYDRPNTSMCEFSMCDACRRYERQNLFIENHLNYQKSISAKEVDVDELKKLINKKLQN